MRVYFMLFFISGLENDVGQMTTVRAHAGLGFFFSSTFCMTSECCWVYFSDLCQVLCLSSTKVRGVFMQIFSFSQLLKNKSGADRSGDRDGHSAFSIAGFRYDLVQKCSHNKEFFFFFNALQDFILQQNFFVMEVEKENRLDSTRSLCGRYAGVTAQGMYGIIPSGSTLYKPPCSSFPIL